MLAVLFALFFVTALAACGDDGDDASSDDAGASGDFCEQADALANDDSLDELDFEDPDDVAIGVGILEDFRDEAPDEIRDDLSTLIDAFEAVAAAGSDPEALAELEEQFSDLDEVSTRVEEFVLEECDVDISGDGGSDDTSGSGSGDDDLEAGEPDDPPSIDDPELEALAEDCHDGDGEACDTLFFQADVDSPEEEYGNTCGGRFDESPGLCATALG